MKHGTCVHFTGCRKSTDACKAGVIYEAAFNFPRTPGMFLRMPCVNLIPQPNGELRPLDRKDHKVIPCALYQEPTMLEIDAHEKEFEREFAKFIAGIKVASEWRVKPKPEADRSEAVQCPICSGRLHLSQSAYNGHVHGHCETDGCLQWME